MDRSDFLSFGTVARAIQTHYSNIVGFFKRQSTNADTKPFNANIKAFRAQLRKVRDITFFLFKLTNIYVQNKSPLIFGMIHFLPYFSRHIQTDIA
ncbi:hypothetical protein [Coprobacter secundus]|uniref:hypothetical protein n=1 Tax=Coprobacter secundus TaxID=1501392 RepID=UPI003C6C1500